MSDMVVAEFNTTCLFCGYIQELHTNTEGDTPQPGDISICFNCGYTAAYGPDLQLVPLSSERQQEVEKSKEYKAMMFALRVVKGSQVNPQSEEK